jgi:alpha-L-fucosidase 2
MGDLFLTFAAGKVTDYSRSLDLTDAIARVDYKKDGVAYHEEAFVSHPAGALVLRVTAEEARMSFRLSFATPLKHETASEGNVFFIDGECMANSEFNRKHLPERDFAYSDKDEERGIRFRTSISLESDGAVRYESDGILVENASHATLRLTCVTSFNGYDKHPFTDGADYQGICQSRRERLSAKSFDVILKAHVRDHSRFFNRVKLDLGGADRSNIATSDRLRRLQAGETDNALSVLLFNLGRYLTIASSRKGSQATNLQGIWNERYSAPWHSNYTVNINTEMNYFPTLAIGLPEMYEPLVRLIKEVSEAGRETAKVLYGAEGWVCHHNTDLWRYTQPVKGASLYSFWNASGGWFCHHLMEYYEYTLDKRFLEKTAYPIMREAARFYLSQLITLDGYRIVSPATSPENSFLVDGARAYVSETTEMTMAVVRKLFSDYLKTCEELCVEDDITNTVKDELPRLLPIRISSDGRIMEWYREHTERDIHHRHLSHLYAFHPAHTYTPDNAPELCEACRRSLEVRGNEGTGWSLAWKADMYAALRDGEMANYFIKKQLRLTDGSGINYNNAGGSYPNMLCAHPPFQIDGNFGVTAAIAEMLLQSDTDTVHIIPAIPKEWENISVKGLRAKGDRRVSFTVRNGELTECEISGSMPSKIFVAGRLVNASFACSDSGCYLKI